ncbi:MAG TPA: HEPN domain-containing protein [Candidatus Acidoferrales bacterium]
MSTPEAEARRWLAYARSDLEAAQELLQKPRHYPRQVCFLAQQAAEKALKAALVFAGVGLPHSHDLDALRNLLPDGWRVKAEHPDLGSLSVWAVEARYPGDAPEAVEADARAAHQQAQTIWESVNAELAERGLSI